jgi:hypothetical protein
MAAESEREDGGSAPTLLALYAVYLLVLLQLGSLLSSILSRLQEQRVLHQKRR